MTNTFKWFKNIKSVEQLKKEYKKLAVKHHPDLGGKTSDMQEINNEYDRLFAELKNVHETAEGKTYTSKTENTEKANEFKDIIEKLIHLAGVKIEIIGSWIWLTGNTYQHREEIKKLDFKWSKSKKAWYFHKSEYRKHNARSFTLDEIRSLYGSEEIKNDPALKLQIV